MVGTNTSSITASLYSTSIDGVAQYTQTFSEVIVVNGAFALKLGPSLPSLDTYKFLELNINNSVKPLSPRIVIATNAKAVEAKKFGGYTAEQLIDHLRSIATSPNMTQQLLEVVDNLQIKQNLIVNESIVTKTIKLTSSTQSCTLSQEGTLRYNFFSKSVEYCDGFAYRSINAPQSPDNLTPTPSDSNASLVWEAVAGAKSYNIYYSENENVSVNDQFVSTSARRINIPNLKNWQKYYFAVQSVDSNGASSLSPVQFASFNPVVKDLAVFSDTNAIHLSWTPTGNTTSYSIFYDQSPQVSTSSSSITTLLSHVSIANLINETSYYFKVKANHQSGSNEFTTTSWALPMQHWTEPTFGIEMVKIPAGTFTMGQKIDIDIYPNSLAGQHQVTISNDFYIGKYEVTVKQWREITGYNLADSYRPNYTKYTRTDEHPADNIQKYQITALNRFLDKLNSKIGCDSTHLSRDNNRYHPSKVPTGCFRLPTEAEWEYMASYKSKKGHEGYPFPKSELSKYSWETSGKYYPFPVKSKIPNPWGLYHVHGNSAEWVYDSFKYKELHKSTKEIFGDSIDPVSSSESNFNYEPYTHLEISRGGSNDNYDSSQSYARTINNYTGAGLRLVAVAPQQTPKTITISSQSSLDSIKLKWNTLIGVNKYEVIYRELTSTNSQKLVTDRPNININNLDPRTKYEFKVKPLLLDNSGTYSELLTTTPELSPVAGLYAIPKSKKVDLKWDHHKFVTSYEIEYSDNPHMIKSIVKSTSNNGISITNLENDRRYYFRIQCKFQTFESAFSSSIQAIPLEVLTDSQFSYEMIKIKSGSHTVSIESSYNTTLGLPQYTPATKTLSRNLFVGKYEVSQKLWNQLMPDKKFFVGNTGRYLYTNSFRGDDYPATQVTFTEINQLGGFLDRLNQLIGCDTKDFPPQVWTRYRPANTPSGCYRLPSAEEWEYIYYTKTSKETLYGIHESMESFEKSVWTKENSLSAIQKIGLKRPSSWGLYDVEGNISEMTSTSYDSTSYQIVKGGNVSRPFLKDFLARYFTTISTSRGNLLIGFRLVKVID